MKSDLINGNGITMVNSELKRAPDIKSGVSHLRSLTGLRFIAAFVVFCAHVQWYLRPEGHRWPLGGPAVSFFFVLSGFILTYVYCNRLRKRDVPRFWFARWARLWPLHIVCLAIVVIATLFFHVKLDVGSDPTGRSSYPSLVAQFLLLQSWLPINSWISDFNGVSWSISTELFFYLMFPLLLLGNRNRFHLKIITVFAVSFGILLCAQYLFDTDAMPRWVSSVGLVIAFPPIRLPEFALGMGTCLLMQKLNQPFASTPSTSRSQYRTDSLWELFAVALIIFAWNLMVRTGILNYLAQSSESVNLFAIWLEVAGGLFFYAFLIYTFARCRGWLGQLMASRLVVWLGEISFAFYLIHQIVLYKLNQLLLSDMQFAILSFGIALFSSALLYRVVEIPYRNALLSIYDHKPGSFVKWTAGLRELFTTNMGRFQAVVLIMLIGILWVRPAYDVSKVVCQEIADNTPQQLRGVSFLEEATLLGVKAKRVELGVKLTMVWRRKRSWSRQRFLHICDSAGNIISHGSPEKIAFKVHPPNQPFVEEVVLPARKIKDAAYIAVGFWSEEDKCASVTNRQAEMGGFRVRIVDLNNLE